MDIQGSAKAKLAQVYRSVAIISQRPVLVRINSHLANLRTTTTERDGVFWFDVTPELYEKHEVEFFIYVCGSPDVMYIFPQVNFKHFVSSANVGGIKQVPNFTLCVRTNHFQPGGHPSSSSNIAGFRNAFFLIPG